MFKENINMAFPFQLQMRSFILIKIFASIKLCNGKGMITVMPPQHKKHDVKFKNVTLKNQLKRNYFIIKRIKLEILLTNILVKKISITI
jgi:hypothetical protein